MAQIFPHHRQPLAAGYLVQYRSANHKHPQAPVHRGNRIHDSLRGFGIFLGQVTQRAVDLAVCCQQQKDPATAAACLLAARDRVLNEKDTEAATKLESRIKGLLDTADPRFKKIEDLDRQLVAAAKPLVNQAAAAGDNEYPWIIDDCFNAMGLSGPNNVNLAKLLAMLKDKAIALGIAGDSLSDAQRQAAMKEWNAWLEQKKVKDHPVKWRLTIGSFEAVNQDTLDRLKGDVESARQDMIAKKKNAASTYRPSGMFVTEVPASLEARAAARQAEAALADKERSYQAAVDFPLSIKATVPGDGQAKVIAAADKSSEKALNRLAKDGEFRVVGTIQDIAVNPKRDRNEFSLDIVLTRCAISDSRPRQPAQPAGPANTSE